jgi:hypothetical protein
MPPALVCRHGMDLSWTLYSVFCIHSLLSLPLEHNPCGNQGLVSHFHSMKDSSQLLGWNDLVIGTLRPVLEEN